MLLDAGALIDAPSGNYRETACHSAARNGHAGFVDLLIARGADLTVCDARDQTPLVVASYSRHMRSLSCARWSKRVRRCRWMMRILCAKS
jgi:ankyrin repeat protein